MANAFILNDNKRNVQKIHKAENVYMYNNIPMIQNAVEQFSEYDSDTCCKMNDFKHYI